MFRIYYIGSDLYQRTDNADMDGQQEAWESFYSANRRPWRGVSKMSAPFPEGCRVLEIGCGNGKTVQALTEDGYSVTGLDFSPSAVEMCRSVIGRKAEFVCGDATNLPFDDDSFDGAVAFHVLEHLTPEELSKAVSEIARVVRPGSHVLVRCFSNRDMRSDKGERIDGSTVVRGNGIMYHYFEENELCQAFEGFDCADIRTAEERTRFGEIRSNIEADFVLKPL